LPFVFNAGKLPASSSRTDKGCNPLFVCVCSFFNVVLLWFRLVCSLSFRRTSCCFR
jgi:hypothetical protein